MIREHARSQSHASSRYLGTLDPSYGGLGLIFFALATRGASTDAGLRV
jgi:hypothetical protein